MTLGSETETFEAPRHHDIDTQCVIDLRRMVKAAGITPELPPLSRTAWLW